MAADDFAIVVGISAYPYHGDLNGPENDARAFYAWLTRPDGGAVPAENVDLILTSDCPPPYADIEEAQPTGERVHRAIRKLQRIGEKNIAAGDRRRIGRRLYFYLAGHGCTPRDDQTALLMANSDNNRSGSGFHILGQYNADLFFSSASFDEVLLFMDCCRNLIQVPALDQPYWPNNDAEAIDRVKRFYALSAKWSLKSWERKMDDGLVHGVFTTALLDGLNGRAAKDGQVTSESLKSWLLHEMHGYLTEDEKKNPEISPEPDVHDFNNDITIVEAEDVLIPVRIHVPPAAIGRKIEILTSKENGDYVTVIETNATDDIVEVSLKRAVYLVEIITPELRLRKAVPVGGAEAVDVRL